MVFIVSFADGSPGTDSDKVNIVAVQKGILSFDRSITIGGAFENYKYLTHLNWAGIEPIAGRTFVEVTGDLDADRIFANLRNPAYGFEFAKTHDMQKVEAEWKPKLSRMKLRCRFRLNADGSVEATLADFGEEGHGPWYLYGKDVDAVVRMVYFGTIPFFILEGFVHTSDGRP
jgi:hypothetical protein